MNYILYKDDAFMHFYHSHSDGLCLRERKNGHWLEKNVLDKNAKNGFCAFVDSNNLLHILYTNQNNDILYMTRKNSEWHNYVLSRGKDELTPLEFKIAQAGNILNFFYTALFKDELILIHCVLGEGALPQTVDTLKADCPQFSISNDKVYYTNHENVLGYRSFSDSKPDIFSPLYENAYFVDALKANGNEYVVFKKDNFICFNGEKVFSDPAAISPIINVHDNKLTIFWQSNCFIRYITSFNNGTTWSYPMRYITSSELPVKFTLQANASPHLCYGQDISPEPILYGKSNLFFLETPKPQVQIPQTESFSPTEYKKLRILIDMQNKEILDLKSKLKKFENNKE